ncbi:hypothetical protein ABIC99_003140, partial [Sphaerotilus sulfidivorans]
RCSSKKTGSPAKLGKPARSLAMGYGIQGQGQYEKLGLELDLLVGRNNLAMVLHQRGFLKDRPEIQVLLKRAYAAAKRLGLPEALRIAQRYRQIFRKPIETVKK